MLIDTHCHLDFKDFDPDRDEVIQRAKAAGIGTIINVGSSLEGSKRAVELSEKHDFIYASVGVHPHDAGSVTKAVFKELRALALSKKVVAVGEVGLDYYRNLSPQDIQKKVFKEFISFSRELGLPLIFHSREAHHDLLDILKKEFSTSSRTSKIRGVMHCFSGDPQFLRECLDAGLCISFTGNITFKNADRLRELARDVPLERILLETDAPFLAPQVYRGRRNEPAYITFLAKELSGIYSLPVEDIARTTTHNANELFGLNIPEEPKIAYEIRDSLYLNITNRCTNECCFCVRETTDYVKGHRLKLEKEPSSQEMLAALKDAAKYKEVVFCGYGEPTLRLDLIKEVARFLKDKGKTVRLITNGHGNLIHKRSIVKELKGLIDKVSVSLNVDTKEKYNSLCRPQVGDDAFEAVISFIKECKKEGIKIEVTCLDLPETDIEKCRFIVENELDAEFRLRRHNVVG